MPAKTAVQLGETFSGTLVVDNPNWPTNYQEIPPQNIVGAGFFACSVNIVGYERLYYSFEVITVSPPSYRFTYYFRYDITVAAGLANSQTEIVFYAVGQIVSPSPGTSGYPVDPSLINIVTSLEVPFSFSVSGIHAGTEVTNSEPTDRQSPKDYTDRTLETSWYADEDTSCTATATIPGYGTITKTKTGLGYNAGDPVDVEPHEIGSNFSCGWGISLNYAPVIDTTLAAIADPQFSASGINLGSLNLHNPGTGAQPPDAITAGWYFSPPASGAYWHVFNDGGIALERCVTATTSGVSWAGCTSLPYLTDVVFNDGAFTDDTSLSIDYDCGAIDWVGGEYVTHYFTGDETRDEFHSDWDPPGWRKWGNHTFSAMEKNAWRAANGEDVGGSVSSENDARAGIKVAPINASTWNIPALGSLVWQMMSVDLADSIDINDPEDAPSRPSDWVAVSGCSVSGDVWTVAASASSPKVKRVLKTRYWLRLNNLQGYSDDPELPRDFNWPIMMRPNINLTNGEDGAVIEAAVPYEDEFHWNQYAYLLLGLTAAKSGTITMQVKYSTVSVYDPCYPGVAYRAEEFEYTRTQATATYNIDVVAGANSLQVDLCCPTEGTVPNLWHVDEIWFTLPDGGEAAEEYTLTGLALTKDTINTNTLRWRSVRCWQWANNLGFGMGAVHDGKHVLWIGDAYGYSAHRQEKCLSYIQFAQHNPGSTAEGDPSTAKSLARMVNEHIWLRGWTATYDINDVDPNPYNEDEDGNVQSSAFYSWDIHEAHEGSDVIKRGATTVGYRVMLAGTRTTMHVEKYPRGKIEGILKNEDKTERVRNGTGLVIIADATNNTIASTCNTDGQGWYCSLPLKEKDKTYRIAFVGSMYQVVNREYTTTQHTIAQNTKVIYDPFIVTDKLGSLLRAVEGDGIIEVDIAGIDYNFGDIVYPFGEVEGYARPSITELPDGRILAAATKDSTLHIAASYDHGETWTVLS